MSEYLYSDLLLIEASKKLRSFDILTPELDSSLLLSHAINHTEKLHIHNKILISKKQCEKFHSFINERIKGKPVSRIIGYRNFWKNDFLINDFTLDPRQDSEIIIDAALKKNNQNEANLQILDIGGGSGCLGLSLLDEVSKSVLLSLDKCPYAITQIMINAKRLKLDKRVETIKVDWFENNWENKVKEKTIKNNLFIKDKFDIIVCNPPYIKSKDIAKLSKEVKYYDPLISLDGGNDGCSSYEAIIRNLRSLLACTGTCFMEIGYDSLEKVKNILSDFDFKIIDLHKDLNNIDRVLEIN